MPHRHRLLSTLVIVSHFIGASCLATSRRELRHASPVDSSPLVGRPIQEQVASAVDLAHKAQEDAANAGADALKVQQDARKAGSGVASVMAAVGAAKAAMDQAVSNEHKISELKRQMWQNAKATALGEIPKVLPALMKKAEQKANKEAAAKAKTFDAKMRNKAKTESANAAKVYTDVMTGAGQNAAEYAKLADNLVAQSASMQMNAAMAQGQANQYIVVGDVAEGQKLMQQSRQNMNMAYNLNSQAAGMYDTSTKITAQMPVYANQAAMAAYHAQAMYDPDAQPPPPPLVFVQQPNNHKLASHK